MYSRNIKCDFGLFYSFFKKTSVNASRQRLIFIRLALNSNAKDTKPKKKTLQDFFCLDAQNYLRIIEKFGEINSKGFVKIDTLDKLTSKVTHEN
jgi:hypothetical protein